jgi:4-hydroxy-2-oxoheptanedioate aldolase
MLQELASRIPPNPVKEAAVSGRRVKGVHLTFAAPAIIEVLSQAVDLDFVFIDGEHGRFDWRDVEAACVAAERHGITPIARTPDSAPATIGRFLDCGVRGIAAPHIETIEEARRVVSAVYFSPLGTRSFGGGRPDYGLATPDRTALMAACNAGVSLCLMIESRRALDIAAELAALQGVDYLSFGRMDLAQSLGWPGNPAHAAVEAAISGAAERIRAAGKPIREDFMTFAWINDLLVAGARSLLGDGGANRELANSE